MTSDDKKPVKGEKNQDATVSAVDQLLQAAARLTDDQRNELAASGFVLPAVARESDLTGPRQWVYQCRNCDRPGLEFLGNRFEAADGTHSSVPLDGAFIDRLPWVQPHIPLHRVNRPFPTCQFCGQPLKTRSRRVIGRFVRNLAQWEREKAETRELMRRSRGLGGGIATHNPDGTPIELSRDYESKADIADGRDPNVVAELDRIAESRDLDKTIYKHRR